MLNGGPAMVDATTTLARELDGLRAMARELEARVEGDQGAARELCAALGASVDQAVRHAGGGGNATGKMSLTGQLRSGRKAAAAGKVRTQVRVASAQDLGPLDDGLSWRKYGQKDILGATYPRAYFRCTHRHMQGCQATKQVQRAAADHLLFDVVYHGVHTCAQAGALLASPEQQPPPAFGLEQQQQTSPGGFQWPVESVTPSFFPSSPASSWCQFTGSYGYAEGGVDMEFESELDELFLNLSEIF